MPSIAVELVGVHTGTLLSRPRVGDVCDCLQGRLSGRLAVHALVTAWSVCRNSHWTRARDEGLYCYHGSHGGLVSYMAEAD